MKKGWKAAMAGCLSLVLLTAAGCGGSKSQDASAYTPEKPLIIKFSHVTTADSPKGKAATKFADMMAEKTGGKVKVEVYPSSQLYGDKDEMEALQAGNVQIIAPSATKLVGFNPAFQIVDMPFLFKNHDSVLKFWDGDLGKKLLGSLDSKNMLGLAMWENGFKVFTANKPLTKPEDFKGLKFRTQAGKVLEAQFKALGSGAATIPFGETYTALQQGTVDGQENTWNNIDTQKYEEVQKHLIISNHGRLDYIVLTNKKWYSGLPEDIRKAFDESMTEATKYERELAVELDKESENKLKSSGKMQVVELSEADREAFVKVMEPVYSEFSETVGKEFIDGARQL
ncbi:TRAP transporter substrate-binding protein [Brevibacillus ruminantium]|uniref:TRAP transporter substrate-binding protein n=1 Tax=Brevibacillus ruminantium TaxID=2950604 RepID=A0ABY4WCF1_9BACL|nr:TRAP transporter substrate-binding protein [Brevibacillus ruminantium]USG64516.1 TRAP transporter substrate-binding protein [Brevibacillus ruminantium]